MSDQYAVIGNPIAHSKSPLIHAQFAHQTRQYMEYGRILGRLDGFAEDVRRFFADGGRGLNVTLPFKQQALEMADLLTGRAERAGAANTLVVQSDGQLRADNTDGVGLVRDLAENQGFDFRGKRVLLLGAGGASHGVLPSLLETGLASLVIANRTASKAVQLTAQVGAPDRVRACGLDELDGERFDLVINGTSAGLSGEVPAIPRDCLGPKAWTYDMLYGEGPTPFQCWGLQHGAAKALDGLGMLVEQAAESFFLWRGTRPATAPVIASLRARTS